MRQTLKNIKFFSTLSQQTARYTAGVLLIVCFFFIVNSPRLLSLDAHWSSDEARWLRRSAVFMDTVEQGRFSETLIAYHPGVVTMWVAGLRTFFTPPAIGCPKPCSCSVVHRYCHISWHQYCLPFSL